MIEEVLTTIMNTTVDSFNFPFCITVNIGTYMIIKTISEEGKDIKLTTWRKRLIFLIISLLSSIIYYKGGEDVCTIFNSIILAPVSWSWIFKPICSKFKIDYSNHDNKD